MNIFKTQILGESSCRIGWKIVDYNGVQLSSKRFHLVEHYIYGCGNVQDFGYSDCFLFELLRIM